jgi:hypothetical protein
MASFSTPKGVGLAQGDRVLVVGFATGRIKATNRKFEDHWVFAITVRNDSQPSTARTSIPFVATFRKCLAVNHFAGGRKVSH